MQETLKRARSFAIAAHGEQMYGDKPYSYHLDAVVDLLATYGIEAQVVGYLHDVVEDTNMSIETVREMFGDRVAACVALVTDEVGASRSDRKARTNAKLATVVGENELALIVKAADRLANLRMSSLGGAGSKLEMYRNEATAFRQAAYRPGLCDELWNQIDCMLMTG